MPKEDQKNKTKANGTDNIIEDFINFKIHLIEQFETMKSSFFVEVNQVKNQLLNKTDSAFASSILERLIVQQQEQISILREQLDRKDKVIDKLLEKLERRDKESLFHCCPSKVPPYIQTATSEEKRQEKQNTTKQQQLNPTQHNATSSNHNKKSATENIISSANSNNTPHRTLKMGHYIYRKMLGRNKQILVTIL